ncbi:hypothetical protein PR003_g7383 [Phytophthora rubi]|uniref:Uncharacterized protein n=1 Tax=Phytophthora rubi TaxID=129364 RepID=A0A6A4FLZ3_9STRA|nr:hypothetical protein PR002_g561 [Phytophthora rubi]KAE9052469.1 hypothetical protein PR001_g473 [Phytophthora rubi]KAE9346505.1 hypothetical protein PR003_g7383 [Phytophthora rubi]
MAASPAVSPAAGMRSLASVCSASPSVTAVRVVAAPPPASSPATTALSTPPPVAASPAAQVDSERAPSAALVADTADTAGEAIDSDSSLNQGMVLLWDRLERYSRIPSLD